MQKLMALFALRLVFTFNTLIVSAQGSGWPFESDIRSFVLSDSLMPPDSNTTIFTGSSSIKMWENLHLYFPKLQVLQRGFGGSTLTDLNHYAKDFLTNHHWKQIVIYSGENDLAFDTTLSDSALLDRYKTLYQQIRAYDPEVRIIYISLKPSISRWHLSNRFIAANQIIKEFITSCHNSFFVDIWPLLLNEQQQPDASLFLPDGLHLNTRGYLRWKQELDKYMIQ